MQNKKVFVTVGTTKFEKLIETISSEEILDKLFLLGYTEVQFQIGEGKHAVKQHSALKLKYDKYFDNFEDEINKSDLIISHAGAGTCLEVLKCYKPLIVVINDDLMDNHQLELAEQLQKDDYLYFCTCDDIFATLSKDFSRLKRYPRPNKSGFSNYLNKCMGFI